MVLVYRTDGVRAGVFQITRDEENQYWLTIPIQHSTVKLRPFDMAEIVTAIAEDLASSRELLMLSTEDK